MQWSITNKLILSAAISVLLISFTAVTSQSHDGELDQYGCHQDEEHRNYHCHEGVLRGGSFESRAEMVRQLRHQFQVLGRPWPYGDLVEEDITSPKPKPKE